MVFSSTIFLFLFLPIVLLGNFIFRNKFRNIFLLLMSLLFYAWGEPIALFLMVASVLANYLFGLWTGHSKGKGKKGKVPLVAAIIFNLGMLGFFKYFGFFANTLNFFIQMFGGATISVPDIALPLGISFYTFQIMSYVIDVYRDQAKVQYNVLNLGLYISLFPQLIAGPIVRYTDIAEQIENRQTRWDDVVYGIRRFCIGLSKKVLIANSVAVFVDAIFALDPSAISPLTAWLAVLGYAIQIYFDFSGYSCMAIGLCSILGFRLNENFNYPYTARNIQDFWRRWHISLSTWFKDYLYIPLGGNRRGKWRTWRNQLIVFLLCGLWHGANWTFVIWGVYHGIFLMLEKTPWKNVLNKLPVVLQHFYAMLIVLIGWVFFRADSIGYAFELLKTMFFINGFGGEIYYLTAYQIVTLVLGVICSMPVYRIAETRIEAAQKAGVRIAGQITLAIIVSVLFVFSVLMVAGNSYNPFIYWKF